MMTPPFEISLPPRFYEDNPCWIGQLRQETAFECRWSGHCISLLAGAVGAPFEKTVCRALAQPRI